jgi:hypothetical protein
MFQFRVSRAGVAEQLKHKARHRMSAESGNRNAARPAEGFGICHAQMIAHPVAAGGTASVAIVGKLCTRSARQCRILAQSRHFADRPRLTNAKHCAALNG